MPESQKTVLITAPAGPFKKKFFNQGVRHIEKAGFNVSFEPSISSKERFLAGSDQRRSQELNKALVNQKAHALLFARGGYGCQRLLSQLPKKIFPKILIGSSDLTALLNTVWQQYKIPTVYGPMVAPHFRDTKNIPALKKILTDPHFFQKQKLKAKKVIRSGRAEGVIVGGCLSLIISTLKTPYEINTDGKILLLEDTHEAPYKVDRMLTQLIQSRKLDRVKGLVLGTFRLKETIFPKEIYDVFCERFKNFKIPILWGIPFGHCEYPLYVPIGLKGEISGQELKVLEPFSL